MTKARKATTIPPGERPVPRSVATMSRLRREDRRDRSSEPKRLLTNVARIPSSRIDSCQPAGGWMRECPVVMKDTLVEATETPDGARIRVSVEDASNVDALRSESRRRLAVLRARR